MGKKRFMAGWYDPAVLAQTGIRVAISTVFGQFADRREALAAANAIEPQPFDDSFDYAGKHKGGDFWFDFVADTGDGWNSTYAVARLLAEDALQPKGATEPLKRGRLLVMGGDQVYPTASRPEYEDRLVTPYEEATLGADGKPRWGKDERPDLYAIPGNHDWYDGLNAFFGLFCRRRIKPKAGIGFGRPGRVVGGRQTQQTRSYFAIRLPGGWWLWATDSQLEGYIDQPQIEYFQHVAGYWMEPGSKLILCVAEPAWAYIDVKNPKEKFANFSYLERLAGAVVMPADRKDRQEKWPKEGATMGHELKLVLTGDSHHYSHYFESERQYLTCGGGGAFLHPTHQLKDKPPFEWEYPEPGVAYDREKAPYLRSFTIAKKAGTEDEALYPGRGKSWLLTLGNFCFAVRNWKFPLVLWPAYLLFTWMLDFNARLTGTTLSASLDPPRSFSDAFLKYWDLAFVSPWPVVLAGAALGGYYYFADVKNGFGRFLMGGLHALFQAVVVTATTCLVVRYTNWSAPWTLIAASAASAFFSATAFGTYLWFSLAILRRHANEAFSSLANRHYKCFARLRIAANGTLTLFPVGLTKVPFDRRAKTRNPELKPHLIEGPIEIA